eukprot:TRINITY_DN2857_c0_g7_i1.p2 TRINITY_DN2857_c0_g7~~TRINITY_DN2857_c0_g7_i1.p2  ORF type:complete len:154 (-),score=71.66 TRINITY_DN2857_c0_g7_i1:296-757(-)
MLQVIAEALLSVNHSGFVTCVNAAAAAMFAWKELAEEVEPPPQLHIQQLISSIHGVDNFFAAGLENLKGQQLMGMATRRGGGTFHVLVCVDSTKLPGEHIISMWEAAGAGAGAGEGAGAKGAAMDGVLNGVAKLQQQQPIPSLPPMSARSPPK